MIRELMRLGALPIVVAIASCLPAAAQQPKPPAQEKQPQPSLDAIDKRYHELQKAGDHAGALEEARKLEALARAGSAPSMDGTLAHSRARATRTAPCSGTRKPRRSIGARCRSGKRCAARSTPMSAGH